MLSHGGGGHTNAGTCQVPTTTPTALSTSWSAS